jgi:hypothetical protein
MRADKARAAGDQYPHRLNAVIVCTGHAFFWKMWTWKAESFELRPGLSAYLASN